MRLATFVAEARQNILEDLLGGQEPRTGEFDRALLNESRRKGAPQMGTTRYEPHCIQLEFIFPDSRSASTVFTVTLEAPERIVFMPVPNWVVENIWQGSVEGSYCFESEAKEFLKEFIAVLLEEENARHFGPRAPMRRE
jgi:hypothetical protein